MKQYKRLYWMRGMAAALMAAACLALSLDAQASLTNEKIKETGRKIDELKEQQDNAKEWAKALQDQENSLKGELAEFNQQLFDISNQINELEIKAKEKESEIQTARKELKQARKTKTRQYGRMKLRIQFFYEKGSTDAVEALLSSVSMADFLNKAEYIEEINRYDRKMLKQYQTTCRQIAKKEKSLKEEKENLAIMQAGMEEKSEEVNRLIAKTQENIQSKKEEIANAWEDIGEYETQIAKMKAYEEELERQKAEEAKKIAAAQKKKEEKAQALSKGDANQKGGSTAFNASDQAMLAALVECEAGGESYEGQLAVASVVVNRVKSGIFPNTISGVIYQGGQFSPAASGRLAMALQRGASESCAKAAAAALSGSTNVSFLYFCRASSGVAGTVIGNHVFF